jgi:hypothetical protein
MKGKIDLLFTTEAQRAQRKEEERDGETISFLLPGGRYRQEKTNSPPAVDIFCHGFESTNK